MSVYEDADMQLEEGLDLCRWCGEFYSTPDGCHWWVNHEPSMHVVAWRRSIRLADVYYRQWLEAVDDQRAMTETRTMWEALHPEAAA